MLKLQIAFTLISAAFLAVALPVGGLYSWGWAGVCGLCAGIFFTLMLVCKNSISKKERAEREKSDFNALDFSGNKSDEPADGSNNPASND